MSQQPYPTPPEPPEVPRKLNLSAGQIAAIVLLLIFPVLMIVGAFGESFDEADASSADVHLSAVYPSRLRFLLDSDMQITVENTSQQTLDGLSVHLETSYIDQFTAISFMPPVSAATDDAYIVPLPDLAPGESGVVTVQFQGSHYGQHEGRVWVTRSGQTAAELQVSSIVYP